MGKSSKARTEAKRSTKVTHAFFSMDSGWKSTTTPGDTGTLTIISSIRSATAAQTTMLNAKIGFRGDDNNSALNPTNLDGDSLRFAKAAAPFTHSNSKLFPPKTQAADTFDPVNNRLEILYSGIHMGDYPVSYPVDMPQTHTNLSAEAEMPRTAVMATIKTNADKVAAIQNSISDPTATETLFPRQKSSAKDLFSTGIPKLSLNDPAFKKLEKAAAALAKMAQDPNALAEKFGFNDEDSIEAIKQLYYPIPSPKPTGIPAAEEEEDQQVPTAKRAPQSSGPESIFEFYAVYCTSSGPTGECDWECLQCVFRRKFGYNSVTQSEKEIKVGGLEGGRDATPESKSSFEEIWKMISFKSKVKHYPDSVVQLVAWLASQWVLEDKSRLTKGIVRQFAEYLRTAYPIREVNLDEEKGGKGKNKNKNKNGANQHNDQIKRLKRACVEEGSAISFSPDIVKWIVGMKEMNHSLLRRLRPYIFQQGVVDGKDKEVYAPIWFHSRYDYSVDLDKAYENVAFVLLNSMLATKYRLQPWNTGDQLFFVLTEKAMVGVFVDLYRAESEGGLELWEKRRKLALYHWRVEGRVGRVGGDLIPGLGPGEGEKRGDRIMLLKEMCDGC